MDEDIDTVSGEGRIFSNLISSSCFVSIEPRPCFFSLAHLANVVVFGTSGRMVEGIVGRCEIVHTRDRRCWRRGELTMLEDVWVAAFRERRRPRDAPERSMVTVVARI